MRFGKSWDDVQNEPASAGNGFIKWLKPGDTIFRILQEPKEWVGYWEHFNPGGYPFPCNSEDRQNCPGCQSDNEKMRKASRKIAFNVLEGEFVNVYKVPKTLADTLDNRATRIGTITDRDYMISRIEGKNRDGSKNVTYDIEGQEKIPVDLSALELKDIEAMLQEAYDQSWGDADTSMQTQSNAKYNQAESDLKAKLKAQEEVQPKDPPFEEASYDEADLRKMDRGQLAVVLDKEGLDQPKGYDDMTPDEIVDWMIEQ